MQHRKKVAIVGSGCSGIGALWALKSTDHEVHLYEADSRLGGHTNTVSYQHSGKTINVDTGFIVMNSATYRWQTSIPMLILARLTLSSKFHCLSERNQGPYNCYRDDVWGLSRPRFI